MAYWHTARGDRDLDSHESRLIARRFCRCLQATYGRSQLRERAFRPLEIPLVPGSSSSAHGGANGGRARVTSRRAPRRALQKRVQSRAYAPPQGPPTRSPPITRDATIPLAAAHTLAAFFSSPAASHAPLRPGPRGRARCARALLPRQTERRIAPGRGSAPCSSHEGVLEPASG